MELSHKPTLILLIFDDFGKISNFLPNFEFFEIHLWVFKIMGNRQTQKQIILMSRKNHVNNVSYP